MIPSLQNTADLVGILYSDQPSDTEPSYFLPRLEVRELKKQHKGGFINHGKHFRLNGQPALEQDARTLQDAHVKARDRSAQMPGKVTEEAVVLESYSAIQLVRGWFPRYRFA